MDHAASAETQAFLSDVADEMEAAAAKLETTNGAMTNFATVKAGGSKTARFASKVVYTACYTFSYGVCFPIFVACRFIPENNGFVEGLIDGSASASRSADDMISRVKEWSITREDAYEEAEVMADGIEALASA